MQAAVLKIDKSGQPLRWISREHAANLTCNNKVLWSFGDEKIPMRGGLNRNGLRSVIYLAPIIAVDGSVARHGASIPLTNRLLFRRDGYRCMYCGGKFDHSELTRDHIIPTSKGGEDKWENTASSCRRCNQKKSAKTPEEANMPLLAVPFRPTLSEVLFLANRHILGDQMQYLEKGFRYLSPSLR